LGEQSGRGLSYALWAAFLQVLATGWAWMAVGSALLAYGAALIRGEGAMLPAGALALAITVSLPLHLIATLWMRMALIDAVEHGRPYTVSLYTAAGWLSRQFFRPFAVLVLCGLAAGLVEATLAASFASVQPQPGPDPRAWLAAMALPGLA